MEKIGFTVKKIIDKKTREKSEGGNIVSNYKTIVQAHSDDVDLNGKPSHKMNIMTDLSLEPGDELQLTFTKKQTKLANKKD